MSNTINLPRHKNYIIKNNTYTHKVVRDGLEYDVEIGDSKSPNEFKPQLKTQAFKNNCNVSVRLVTNDPGISVESDRQKITAGNSKSKSVFYEIDEGFEFGLTLVEKPVSNIVEYSLQHKNVNFFRQPMEVGPDSFMPENVKGSYAVYADRKFQGIGQREYRVGKVMHIYRPWAEDSAGNRVWCDLLIDPVLNKMTIEIPQEFLDSAQYPVFLDPTFGYTSIGATELSMSLCSADNVAARHYTAEADKEIKRYHTYGRVISGTGSVELGVYDMALTNDPSGATLLDKKTLTITNNTLQWLQSADVNVGLTQGNNYCIAQGGGELGSGIVRLVYDNNLGPAEMRRDSDTTGLPATFVSDAGDLSYMITMYAEYGALPGPPLFTGTIPNWNDARTTPVSIATGPYFSDADSFSVANLPAGASFNTATGLLTWNSPVNGTYSSITVTATNALGSDTSNAFSITINAQAPVWNSAITNQTGNQNNSITDFNVSGLVDFATSFSATNLPTGLSIDSGTGIISGTPTVQDIFSPFITATNVDGSTNSNTFTWTIGAPLPIPTITDVNGGNGIKRGETFNITGTNFQAPQGAGSVTFGGLTLTINSWTDTVINATAPTQGLASIGGSYPLVVTNNSAYQNSTNNQLWLPETGYAVQTSSLNYAQLPTSSFLHNVAGIEAFAVGDQVIYQVAASPQGTVSVDDQMVMTITGAGAAGDYTSNYSIYDVSDQTISANGTALITLQASDSDVTAPVWTSFPNVINITTTGGSFTATINEMGDIFAVVVPQSDLTPSVAQVLAGQNASGTAAILAFSATAVTAITQSMTLSSGTAYKVCAVARDDEPTPNVQASVTTHNFTTLSVADTTPPNFATGPTLSQVLQNTVTLDATIDEPGTIFWAIVSGAYADPDPTEVVTGLITNPSSEQEPASASGSGASLSSVVATGLAAGTSYKACFAARDTSNNLQTASTVLPFTTSPAGTTRSITDTLTDPDTGLAVANTTIDYQIQPVWATAPTDSGQFTTDGAGGFTISNIAAAAGAARLIIKSVDGLQGGQKSVTITEA